MRCSIIRDSYLTLAIIGLMLGSVVSAQEASQWYPGSSNGLRDPVTKIEQTSSNDSESRYGNNSGLKPITSQPDITPIRDQKLTSSSQPSAKIAKPKNSKPITRRYGDTPQKSMFVKSNDFQTRLTALELAVSTVVAEEPNLWRFEPLELEATQLLILASDETERETVRQLAKRLEGFSSLAERYRNARTQMASNIATSNSFNKAPAKQEVATKPSATSSEYDAIGVLRPVVSKRPGAPKFALVDKEGQITSFVTPEPGVDLQSMLGKRLGVRGSRGYIPEFQRDHVTAERVAMISNSTIR